MSREDWEHYIKTLEFGKCKSDFLDLVQEMKAKFWFAARKREFNKLNIRELEETIEDKYALELGKCITSRGLEVRNGIICEVELSKFRNGVDLSEVARDTLKALIAELKIEQLNNLAEAIKRYEAPGDLGVNCCPTAILINVV